MFTAESNAVNLTDGLDGLATGLSMIAISVFVIFAVMNKIILLLFMRCVLLEHY